MKYTEEMLEWIRNNSWGKYWDEVRIAFNEKFGVNVEKTPSFRSTVKRYNIYNGIDGKFKKGQVPHNKGKKMSKETLEKLRPTLFQKGKLNGRAKQRLRPLFSERIDSKDGYIHIKIKDHGSKQWVLKHRWIWEQHYGEIPKGYNCIFLDGDRLNCDISNLRLISKAENMIIASKGLLSDDPQLRELGINAVRLEMAIREKKKDS